MPSGFAIDVFARDLNQPRLLRVAPNGDLFVAESAAGQIRVLRTEDGSPNPVDVEVFATDLDRPFGIAFYPPGPAPQWMYVANTNSIVRFAYTTGDLKARGTPQTVLAKITQNPGGHWTRDMAFSPDGKRLLLSVGSASNVAEGLLSSSSRTTSPRGRPSTASAPRGTTRPTAPTSSRWTPKEGRAHVRHGDPQLHVGLADPSRDTGDPWCSVNERDGLGDNLVPDYVTRVRQGAFYGWPWYYLGDHEDPRHAGERPDLPGKITVPDVLLQAHSAPLQLTFYDGSSFPEAYRGDAFVAAHGSWRPWEPHRAEDHPRPRSGTASRRASTKTSSPASRSTTSTCGRGRWEWPWRGMGR